MDKVEKIAKLAHYGIHPFPVGQVFNPLHEKLQNKPQVQYQQVSARQPARLSVMVLDYERLVQNIRPQVCTAGAVAFGVDIPTTAHVQLKGESGEICIGEQVKRASIVRHAAMIMRSALGTSDGLTITIDTSHDLVHAGLGSSASLQVAVASAINHLYGTPIPQAALIRYLSQNYGEEIEGDQDHLIPVQSLGESAAIGQMGGGMVVLTGEATVIAHMQLSAERSFVIGIPYQYTSLDSLSSFASETDIFGSILQIGKETRHQTAYEVLHKMLPAMIHGDLFTIGEVIRQNRLNEANINRFDLRFPGLKKIILRLLELMEAQKIDILSISSAGPGIFAYTSCVDEVADEFRRQSMKVIIAPANNTGITYKTL